MAVDIELPHIQPLGVHHHPFMDDVNRVNMCVEIDNMRLVCGAYSHASNTLRQSAKVMRHYFREEMNMGLILGTKLIYPHMVKKIEFGHVFFA